MLILLLLLIIIVISVKYGGKKKEKSLSTSFLQSKKETDKKPTDDFIYWIPKETPIYCENDKLTDDLKFMNGRYGTGFILLDTPQKPCVIIADKRIDGGSWQYMPNTQTFVFPVPHPFNYENFIKERKVFYETARTFASFQKVDNPFNPPIIIEKYPVSFLRFAQKRKVSVFRDDLLYGGTKQRALLNYALFMGAMNYDCVIYAGPPQGVAQVALGVICAHLKKPAVMIYADPSFSSSLLPSAKEKAKKKAKENNKRTFLQSKNESPSPSLLPSAKEKCGEGKFPMSCKAAKMGVRLICGGALLDEVQEFARNYALENKGLLLPFGLDDPNFKGFLVEALCEAIPREIREEKIVLWTIVGSGLLLNVFYEVFPNAFIMGVRAGKPIYFYSIDPGRTFTITTRYRFTEVPETLPPYPTVPCYDGKIWEQFLKLHPSFHFADGKMERIIFDGEDFERKHYIWNVANEIL